MLKAKNDGRDRWWSATRSYHYDSHDEDNNWNGLTKEAWKKMILEEYDASKLNAHHVTIIFHDRDTEIDDHGNVVLKELHVHVCIYFVHGHTDTAVMQALGCSRLKNVKVIEKNKRSRAYRYLLHVSEGALNDGKFIYGEDELIISKLTDSEKYDYHSLTKASKEEEDAKEEKDLLKKTVKDILKGVYDGVESRYAGERYVEYGPLNKLLRDEKIARIIGSSVTNERTITNALKTREKILLSEENWKILQKAKKKN